MLNRIVLIGRLTRDPELRYTPSAKAVTSFTLAVDRRRNQLGERETDFIDVVTWGRLAETCSKYLSKGRLVAVEGRLQIRSYETQDGQKRKVAEVVADGIHFMPGSARAEPEGPEDVPFEDAEPPELPDVNTEVTSPEDTGETTERPGPSASERTTGTKAKARPQRR